MLKCENIYDNPPKAETKADKAVMKIMKFIKADATVIPRDAEQTAEEHERETTRAILTSTSPSGLVRLIDTENAKKDDWADLPRRNAIRAGSKDEWHVFLPGKHENEVMTTQQIADATKFTVLHPEADDDNCRARLEEQRSQKGRRRKDEEECAEAKRVAEAMRERDVIRAEWDRIRDAFSGEE